MALGSTSTGSSEDESELCGCYSLSADIGESQSSSISSFSSSRHFHAHPPPNSSSHGLSWDPKPLSKEEVGSSVVEMMKERFAKLLLGEDMSGGGKGVCTALAISNAITNLSATAFGELWRLEPLAPQKKAMWCREMEWLLCVSDSIVELVPSVQEIPGGGTYEVMETRPRSDLYMNLPALKKLDAILLSILDGFDEKEFWYVDGGIVLGDSKDNAVPCVPGGKPSIRQEEKWWLPCPKVPLKGLSEGARKKLQSSRECTNQILKAAMAINSGVLAEMDIPSEYLESLPKSGKACVGDIIYSYLTEGPFSPECLLDCLDFSSDYHTRDIANRIEVAALVWNQKDQKKHRHSKKNRRSYWGGKVKSLVAFREKHHVLSQRAETLLKSLKQRFPGLPQTALDMAKIQYNKDIGQSTLESYSRVMESLAFNIMARIDDVLYVDDATKGCAAVDSVSLFSRRGMPIQKLMCPSPFSIELEHTPYASPLASPLATPAFPYFSPFMGSPHSSRTPSAVRRNSLMEAAEPKSDMVIPTDFEMGSLTPETSVEDEFSVMLRRGAESYSSITLLT